MSPMADLSRMPNASLTDEEIDKCLPQALILAVKFLLEVINEQAEDPVSRLTRDTIEQILSEAHRQFYDSDSDDPTARFVSALLILNRMTLDDGATPLFAVEPQADVPGRLFFQMLHEGEPRALAYALLLLLNDQSGGAPLDALPIGVSSADKDEAAYAKAIIADAKGIVVKLGVAVNGFVVH